MYTLCPAGCGKKFITKEHAVSHADLVHPDWMTPKQKGWRTPYGFCDFTKPVTYEEACAFMKQQSDLLFNPGEKHEHPIKS